MREKLANISGVAVGEEVGVPISEPYAPNTEIGTEVPADWDPSVRNRYLGALTRHLAGTNSRIASVRYHKREAVMRRESSQATKILGKACGACVLSDRCGLAFNAEAWEAVYPDAVRATRLLEIQSATDLMRQLRRDPFTPCDPALPQEA